MNMNDAFIGSLIFNKNGGGTAPTITIYNGTKTNVLTDGKCSITIADMGSCNIIQISGFLRLVEQLVQ